MSVGTYIVGFVHRRSALQVSAQLLRGEADKEAGRPLFSTSWQFGSCFSSGSLPPMFWHLVEAIVPTQGVDTGNLIGSTRCHSLAMMATVAQTNAKNILELGCRTGGSTLPLLLGAYLTNGALHSVDIMEQTFKAPSLLQPQWHR